MLTDLELLRQYAGEGDDAAFTEVVRRHTDFVYATALRVAANPALAQDVTQKVFIKMAGRAEALCHYRTLVGWLHTTARHMAVDAIRLEARRRAREQEASAMQNNPATREPDWAQLRPILDDAVGRLPERDRAAVLLRFFKGLSLREVGAELGLSEDTARKRVERAVEKMRGTFARRGITVSSALLAATIGSNSAEAAPLDLSAQVARASLAAKVAGTAGGLTFFEALSMNIKIKIALGVGLATLGAVGLAIKFHQGPASTILSASTSSSSALKPTLALPTIALAPGSVAPPTAKPAAPSSSSDAGSTAFGGVPSEAIRQNMEQIAKAYINYSVNGGGRTLQEQPGDSAHVAAVELARLGLLNDASLYFVPGDPHGPNSPPKTVLLGNPSDPSANTAINPAFANATLSIEMAANIPLSDTSTSVTETPLLWTRGLRDDGTWAADSPFAGTGGYITYLDGHTEWVDKFLIDPKGVFFLKYGTTNTPTLNIREALPPGAVILSAEPKPVATTPVGTEH